METLVWEYLNSFKLLVMISVNTKRIKDMGTLRYVKTPAELQEAAENNLEFFDATMQAVKVFYKTTPGLIEQLIPAPLSVADDPMVRIVMSRHYNSYHWVISNT